MLTVNRINSNSENSYLSRLDSEQNYLSEAIFDFSEESAVKKPHHEKIVPFSFPKVLVAQNPGDAAKYAGFRKSFGEKIAEYEGFSEKKHWDVNGWSIGYGHKIAKDNEKKAFLPQMGKNPLIRKISTEQASYFLAKDLAVAKKEMRKIFGNVKLEVWQEEALTDLVYNMGAGEVKRAKKLIAAIKEKRFKDAIKEFNFIEVDGKANAGLCKRRMFDLLLFADKSNITEVIRTMQELQDKGFNCAKNKDAFHRETDALLSQARAMQKPQFGSLTKK